MGRGVRVRSVLPFVEAPPLPILLNVLTLPFTEEGALEVRWNANQAALRVHAVRLQLDEQAYLTPAS